MPPDEVSLPGTIRSSPQGARRTFTCALHSSLPAGWATDRWV
jgi:hypothetical protein